MSEELKTNNFVMRQMKRAALGCFYPNLKVTDGTLYALLKPEDEITHRYCFANKRVLVQALCEIYGTNNGTIELTSYPIQQEDGSWTSVDAVSFKGEEIVRTFSEDLAAYNTKIGRGL